MIYLMRHGVDDESKIGGYSNESLIDKGIKQVIDAKNYIDKNIDFKNIISSDIKRAYETAMLVNENNDKKIIQTSLLREQDKGLLNGVKKSSLDKDNYFLGNVSIYDKYPLGESLLDLYDRISNLLLTLNEWDNNLIVTHRGVINMIYYIYNDDQLDMNKNKYKVDYASIHRLDIKNKKIERIY